MKGINRVFLLLACATCIFGYIPCPETHIEREGKCCRPTNCSIYEGFSPCKSGTAENPGLDTCYRCPDGQLSGEIINTKDFLEKYDLCHIPDCDCPPEAEIVNFKECSTTGARKLCRCAVSKGFYGSDAYACKRVDPPTMAQIQRKGYELLLTGEVRECQEGFYKEKSDSSSCLPHKNCPPGYKVRSLGSKVKDTECVLVIISTTLESEAEYHVKSSTPPLKDLTLTGNSSTDEGGGPTSSGNDDILSLAIALSVSLTVFVVIGCVVLYKYMYRQQRISSKRNNFDMECNNNTTDGNNGAVPVASPANADENARLLHVPQEQLHRSSLNVFSQPKRSQGYPPLQPPTSLPGTHGPNDSFPGLLESQSVSPSVPLSPDQPAVSHASLNNEDQVSLSGNAVDFSILDDKTEKPTEKLVGIVFPSRPEMEDDSDQIHASPEQEDSGELHIGVQPMYTAFETVHLGPIENQPQNDEDETISKEL